MSVYSLSAVPVAQVCLSPQSGKGIMSDVTITYQGQYRRRSRTSWSRIESAWRYKAGGTEGT